jgi:type I restriction enzyme, S subunit
MITEAHPRPIKDYCLGIFDGPHATPSEADDGPIFLGIKNITDDGRLNLSEIRHVSEQEFPRWTKRVSPRSGDVVFTYEATLHRYAVIPEGFRGCLGRRVALVRPDPLTLNSRFLLYYFLSFGWRRIVEAAVINGATVDRIPLEKIPDFPVRIPDLDSQNSIAKVLAAYDDLITNNDRRITLLERSARLLFEEWFVRLRYPGHEHDKIVDGLPAGWRAATISDLGKVITGKTPSTISEANFNGGVHFVKTPDMHGKRVVIDTIETLSEQGARSQVNKYIPPMSTMVSCIGSVGVVALNAMRCQTNQQINSIIPRAPEYTFYNYFVAMNLKAHLEAIGGGATMTNVNKAKFESMKCVIPSQSFMREFDEWCRLVFSKIAALRRLNQKATAARDLLLPRLMDGRIEV